MAVTTALSGILRHYWSRERSLVAPAALESIRQGGIRNPEFRRPFPQRHCSAVKGHEVIASLIGMLLFCCRPAAVAWFVIAIVVDAVYRVLGGWSWSHIGEKVHKSVPALANYDSTSTVIHESRMSRIGASLHHAVPGCIRWAHCGVCCMAVCCLGSNKLFSLEAAARFTAPGCVVSSQSTNRSALAPTEPAVEPAYPPSMGYNGPARECLSGEVNKSWHFSCPGSVKS